MRGQQGERLVDERRVLVQQLGIFAFGVAGESGLAGAKREPVAPVGVDGQCDDGMAESAHVIGSDQEAVLIVSHGLGEPAGVGGDHREARGHRFERHEPTRLGA